MRILSVLCALFFAAAAANAQRVVSTYDEKPEAPVAPVRVAPSPNHLYRCDHCKRAVKRAGRKGHPTFYSGGACCEHCPNCFPPVVDPVFHGAEVTHEIR